MPQQKPTKTPPVVKVDLPGLGVLEIEPGDAPPQPLLRGPQTMNLPGLGTIEYEGGGSDENPLQVLWDYAKRNPAAAGGMVGGLVAAPFTGGMSLLPGVLTAGGAGVLGAAGGLGLDKALGGEATQDMTLPEAAKQVAVEGGMAALGEGGGRALMGVAKAGANTLMDSALGGQKALRKNFAETDLADTLNRNAINPTTKRGVRKAERLRDQTVDIRNQMTSEADRLGALPIDVLDPEFQNAMQAVFRHGRRMVKAGLPDPRQEIIDRWMALANSNPQLISMRDASDIINELVNEGERAYTAFKAGELPHDIAAETAKTLADTMRGVQRRQVPGIQDVNREAAALIEAVRAAKDASAQPFRLGGWTSKTLSALGGGMTYGLTHDPIQTFLIGSLPWVAGSSRMAAPLAIGGYHTSRLLPHAGRVAAPAVPTGR